MPQNLHNLIDGFFWICRLLHLLQSDIEARHRLLAGFRLTWLLLLFRFFFDAEELGEFVHRMRVAGNLEDIWLFVRLPECLVSDGLVGRLEVRGGLVEVVPAGQRLVVVIGNLVAIFPGLEHLALEEVLHLDDERFEQIDVSQLQRAVHASFHDVV